MSAEKLIAKIIISGKIETKTGLHIGGSKASLDIGGIDLNVIKNVGGVPFIPGSSLKGKLRSLLAKIHGSLDVKEDTEDMKRIFGDSGQNTERGYVTRLLVRDADLDTEAFANKDWDMEMEYTDSKWENVINRKKGTAEHPRQLERVPADVSFKFEMVYDLYDDLQDETKHLKLIRTAMKLLENDYIGGHGSRGYGKIAFKEVQFKKITVANYEQGKFEAVPLSNFTY